MKKVYFEKPINLYELKKTYTDSVEFISDTATFPMVKGIAYEGQLNKAIKNKLHSKDMKKKIDRLLEVYKRRLFRQWDDHVDQLLHKLSLPTTTVQKGGLGSGCNPEVGTCGRPSTGTQEEHPLVQEARNYNSAEEFIAAKFKEVTLKDAMKEAGRITLGTEPTEIKGKTVWAGNSGRNVDQMVQQLEDMTDVESLAQRAKQEELPQIMQVKERAEKALHNLKMKGDFNNYQERYKAQLKGAWNASRTKKFEKADNENKDSDSRKAVIAAIIASLGLSLSDSALDFYRKAYLLGKERGISISGEEFRAAINDEATNKLSSLADTNRDYQDGPGPWNCIARYVAPSNPMSPIQWRITSLAITPFGNEPSNQNRIVSGTFNSNLPVPNTKPASVLPMPVANSPNAPAMHVCESVPSKTSPGRVWPLAGNAV